MKIFQTPMPVTLATIAISGCAWFTANRSVIETDAAKLGACVMGQVLEGNTDPVTVASVCAAGTISDVGALVVSLIAELEGANTGTQGDALKMQRLHQLHHNALKAGSRF